LKNDRAVLVITLAILANGVTCLLQILFTRFPRHPLLFGVLLPFGLFHLSRSLTLTIGFMLLYLSLRIYQRHIIAWWLASVSCALAIFTHLGQFELWYTSIMPAATLVLLIVYRDRFTVKAVSKNIAQGLSLVALFIAIALVYGTMGFWFLDKRDFGINFTLQNALVRTLREFTLVGNNDLVAESKHAIWFLKSLHLLGIFAGCVAAYSFFRSFRYKFTTPRFELDKAKIIVARSGRSSYDYFKAWPDKTFYFSDTNNTFIAYKAVMGVAVCLGDPVGQPFEVEETIESFQQLCNRNGWIVAFLLPDLIQLYKKLGFSVMKISEGAIVDLNNFSEKTAQKKYFRYIRRKLEGEGNTLTRHKPPHPESLIKEVEEVSLEWLTIPGHREFGFIQGNFDRVYLDDTPLTVLRDPAGKALAFVNEIPSYRKGEATIDMMRHRPGVHWGAMDYIFQGLLQLLKQEGYSSFYLGLAGIVDNPGPTLTERAFHQLSLHLNWIVHSRGVRQFKEKFKPIWEDRYLVYNATPLMLPKIALAVARVL
jgi:phosphatidylglycerol lysyltransferase